MTKCLTVSCPDDSLGYVAEQPDTQQFIGLGYGPTFDPPLNSKWTNLAVFEVSYSPNSALEAALNALATSIQQTVAGWKTQTNQAIPTYGNAPTSATGTCPDGSMFTYGVVAGLFVALTQEQADNAAQSYVNGQLLPLHIVCLSELPPTIFASVQVSETITATGSAVGTTVGSNQWNVVSGILPPGLTLAGDFPVAGQATLSGECPMAGTYNFTVQIITPAGDYMEKAYTIVAEGVLTNAPATQQYAFIPYSFQFGVQAGFAPATLAITAGALPPGMEMTTGGFLTGTPEALGSYTFTVTVSTPTSPVSESFTMFVGSPVTNSPPATSNRATPLSFQFTTLLGTEALTWSIGSGALPQGLTLSASGLLSGIPVVAQSFASIFTVNASDGVGTISQQYSMVVGNAEQIVPSITGTGALFNGGVAFNAGTYQINYITGSLSYGDAFFGLWQVNNAAGGANRGSYVEWPTGLGTIPCSSNPFTTQAAAAAESEGTTFSFTINAPTQLGIQLACVGYAGNIPGSPNPSFSLIRTS